MTGDENVLDIPAELRTELLIRRGGTVPSPPPAIDPSAAARVADRLAGNRAAVDRMLGHLGSDPGAVRAARAYLDGEPDPRGAAAVALVETHVSRGEEHDRWTAAWSTENAVPWVDAWAVEHGLAFAARAGAEADGLAIGRDELSGDHVLEARGWSEQRLPWATGPAGRRTRALLAVADEADHAAAVAGLAGHRAARAQRQVVAFLVPDQEEWVDECVRERPGPETHGSKLLWCSVGSAGHLARLRGAKRARFGDDEVGLDVLLTAAEGIGPAVAPLLAAALKDTDWEVRDIIHGAGFNARARKAIFQVLSPLPSDEAFAIVAADTARPGGLAALTAMIERFPVRAVRLLAERSGESDQARLLLSGHLRAHPELASRVLDAQVRSAVEAVEKARTPEAPESAVPKALRRPGKDGALRWAPTALLPQILMRGREDALPEAATANLLAALGKASPKRPPTAPLREALDALDPVSLARFGWALFELGRSVGEESRAVWAQLCWTGDDETMRRLGALARAATGQSHIRMPLNGLDVLAASGSDVALLQLHLVAEKARPKRLKNKAGKLLAQVAEARGLTLDQLADRMVPDFGLDASGGMTLDFGPRSFRVGFDEQLRPVVFDGNGTLRKSLPKPGAKDDPDLAEAAVRAFAGLKKDVRSAASDLVRRMERAMARQRRWSAGDFRRFFAEHPLACHLARRLVWLSEDGGGAATAFRVAEDRSFAGVDDEALVLPDSGAVLVAHPLRLGETVAAWSELFADYEILQPFPQLGRPVGALTERERASDRIERFTGTRVGVGSLLRLEREGWRRGPSGDGGMQSTMRLDAPTGHTVVLDVFPGFLATSPAGLEEQTLEGVWITDHDAYDYGGDKSEATFAELDDVTASELLYALNTVASHT
ncbi:hypothetical protein GCM10009527_037290 [Actinomadura nitritigenes]|uniref:DUF4132 domain-containing protein n=1 Tax=Actinomadura nitritigenes TaxID=134602 RepID=A0ABS3QS02_9ACTN|nr:DUF4132 domain-containing protein [Actinomadura nitritigenes]MBO2436532.1 DUF4132 domain-containing protein [Actinomadura nitritigenes]